MHYAASKAAVISITQSAALALAAYNINVNAVSPGVVQTPMWEQTDQDRGRLLGLAPGEAMAQVVETIPLKRAAQPEDIVGAVAFLCSPDAGLHHRADPQRRWRVRDGLADLSPSGYGASGTCAQCQTTTIQTVWASTL